MKKTIKFDQKQSILTQGAHKTIKNHQKTIKFDHKQPGAAFGGAPRALPRPGVVVLVKIDCFLIVFDCFLSPWSKIDCF